MPKVKPQLPRVVLLDKAGGNMYVVDLYPRQSVEYVVACIVRKFKLDINDCRWMVTSNKVQFFPDGVTEWKEELTNA